MYKKEFHIAFFMDTFVIVGSCLSLCYFNRKRWLRGDSLKELPEGSGMRKCIFTRKHRLYSEDTDGK
jgi:hypothetical protein